MTLLGGMGGLALVGFGYLWNRLDKMATKRDLEEVEAIIETIRLRLHTLSNNLASLMGEFKSFKK